MQGPPTNFRKEELPAFFSDAESVLSPTHKLLERPSLTNLSQHPDVSSQPRADAGGAGEEWHCRNRRVSALSEGENSTTRPKDEHKAVSASIRECMKPSRWSWPN
ncbi:hypothetical protein N7510_007638 [Penicillium lagena]|uniref:uncharacterized protein n=1 Tax=Penicillium lagena TaxID=94218 RepID=UPI0025408FC1|nr:uncharacterized protein N7510_007638 [Penicillium lagena]KAJ5610919.1 hypothetical protein N7510_007638 [Penicillium lagena]